MKPSKNLFLRRIQLFCLGFIIVFRYSYFFFKKDTLRIKFLNEEDSLNKIHIKNSKAFAEFATGAKGALIKLGQFISSRADIVPESVIKELSILQDQVQAESYDVVLATIKNELGKSVEEIFSSFEKTPIGAASLGQVHFARLKTGVDVAVKIQYPQIDKYLEQDFSFLTRVLKYLQKLVKRFQFLPIIEEFKRAVLLETNYKIEADNAKKIKKLLSNITWLRIPEIIDDFSSEKVLTMTFIKGYKIKDQNSMKILDIDPDKIMSKIIELYCEQIFLHGFFQSDPHPGNLFFDLDENKEIVIGLIDFGQVKEVPAIVHTHVIKIFTALLLNDIDTCAKEMSLLGFVSESSIPRLSQEIKMLYDRAFPNGFSLDILIKPQNIEGFTTEPNIENPVNKENIGNGNKVFIEFSKFLREIDGLTIPGDVMLYIRTMSLLYGLSSFVAPNLKLAPIMLPYMMKILFSR